MAYLKQSDYSLRISIPNLIEILTEAGQNTGLSNDNIRTNAESWAQATIKSYLKAKYNIDTEFTKTATADPDTRDRQIIQVMIDLVLCTIHKTINPRDIPDHINNGCVNAIQWLKEARDGLLILDLNPAPLPAGAQEFNNTFSESQPKFISKPYTDLKLFDNEL